MWNSLVCCCLISETSVSAVLFTYTSLTLIGRPAKQQTSIQEEPMGIFTPCQRISMLEMTWWLILYQVYVLF